MNEIKYKVDRRYNIEHGMGLVLSKSGLAKPYENLKLRKLGEGYCNHLVGMVCKIDKRKGTVSVCV